jgi:hypothetical protein
MTQELCQANFREIGLLGSVAKIIRTLCVQETCKADLSFLRRDVSGSKMARKGLASSYHAGEFFLKGSRFLRIRVRVDAQRLHGFL